MTVEAMTAEDVPAVLEVAWLNRLPKVMPGIGAHGAVVRDGTMVVAFCFLRETVAGFVVDELWSDTTTRGKRGLSMLADWAENVVASIALKRGEPIDLGGIVLHDNVAHDLALEKRGYDIVGNVRRKRFFPEVAP